jgi:hypothetical protein
MSMLAHPDVDKFLHGTLDDRLERVTRALSRFVGADVEHRIDGLSRRVNRLVPVPLADTEDCESCPATCCSWRRAPYKGRYRS